MRLKLRDIGIIKEADIKLDGLTVIAGENDSGKSTVGKVLYGLVKSIIKKSNYRGDHPDKGWCSDQFNTYILKLFKNQISQNGKINFEYDNAVFDIEIKRDRCIKFDCDESYSNQEPEYKALFIDSPFIWNILPSLKTMNNLESHGSDVDFELLETIKDLYLALAIKLKDNDKIKIDIEPIVKGNFQENDLGDFVFKKNGQNIEIVNTAMGIKYFGILQVLSDKNHFYNGQILILDEPEVHLHPKWQLELAKVIIELVHKGVKILVNSHSPYMIEALQRYAQKRSIPNNFYLADQQKIVEDEQSLSKIFAKLSEPFDEFDKMDSESLNG